MDWSDERKKNKGIIEKENGTRKGALARVHTCVPACVRVCVCAGGWVGGCVRGCVGGKQVQSPRGCCSSSSRRSTTNRSKRLSASQSALLVWIAIDGFVGHAWKSAWVGYVRGIRASGGVSAGCVCVVAITQLSAGEGRLRTLPASFCAHAHTHAPSLASSGKSDGTFVGRRELKYS